MSGTLSLDLDRAEHFLIHCKWNVDLLVQRYTDDPETLIMAAGLKCRNPQPPPSPTSTCPVCLSPRAAAEPAPSLSCMHYCCQVRRSRRRAGPEPDAQCGVVVLMRVFVCVCVRSPAGRST